MASPLVDCRYQRSRVSVGFISARSFRESVRLQEPAGLAGGFGQEACVPYAPSRRDSPPVASATVRVRLTRIIPSGWGPPSRHLQDGKLGSKNQYGFVGTGGASRDPASA